MTAFIRRLAPGCALAFGLLALTAALAQPPGGLLDEERRLREIAAQKTESEVRSALADVRKATAAEALPRLRNLLATLEADTTLKADRRAEFLRHVKDQIRLTEAAVRSGADRAGEDAARDAAKDTRRQELEKKKSESEAIRSAIKTILSLDGQGLSQQAQ